MPKKTKLNYCPWEITEDGMAGVMRGLRGKRRQTVKIAITRALTTANKFLQEAEADPRLKKAKRLGDQYVATLERAKTKLVDETQKLLPDVDRSHIVSRVKYYGGHSWNDSVWRMLTDPKLKEIGSNLRRLVKELQDEQAAEQSKRWVAKHAENPCGHEPPTPRVVKNVVSDPKLKAKLDAFTSTLREEEDD